MPVAATNTPPPIRTLVGRALAIIAREGKLIVGSVTRSAAAGATPSPVAIMVCMIGISEAVGMAKSVPALASINIGQNR